MLIADLLMKFICTFFSPFKPFLFPSFSSQYDISLIIIYSLLAEGPCIDRGKKVEKYLGNKIGKKEKLKKIFLLACNTPRPPMSVHKNFSPIGPVVWPAIGNIYTIVLVYR